MYILISKTIVSNTFPNSTANGRPT
ncbi:uncharacterized protein METZ01_LOCUS435558 [marine metagenome]|uniref:Uncharacterized protein n=1 Tax=marine metagenome TaxID=408172 RepID=A0A382YHK1_9ZZZZ